jgi:hypothetical protein
MFWAARPAVSHCRAVGPHLGQDDHGAEGNPRVPQGQERQLCVCVCMGWGVEFVVLCQALTQRGEQSRLSIHL